MAARTHFWVDLSRYMTHRAENSSSPPPYSFLWLDSAWIVESSELRIQQNLKPKIKPAKLTTINHKNASDWIMQLIDLQNIFFFLVQIHNWGEPERAPH